jgi:O-antigen ligase
VASYQAVGQRSARRLPDSDNVDRHASAHAQDAFIAFLVMLLGMSVALDRFLPVTAGPITPTFALMLGLATLGYWVGVTDAVLRRFLSWALAFSGFAVISLAANTGLGPLKGSAGILLWMLAIPGLATVCTDRRRFRALILGLVIGATVLLVVVVSRFLRGVQLLDAAHPQLLGLNRNAIDLSIVWLIPPVLWSPTFNAPRFARWLFVAASVLWLTNSHGRTGLVALILVPLVFASLKPTGGASRGVRIAVIIGVGVLFYTALPALFPNVPAVQRITRYETAKRTAADDIRTLLNEKSIALAKKHPVTGVGFNRYENQYDPVIEKARTAHIREDSLTLPAHNTYYEILATTGIPGFLLFIGALLVPLIAGIRHATSRDVQAVTAGYVIVLFCVTFHTSYGAIIALPLTLTLAAIARARADEEATAAAL